jgi:hypothetical protein
LIISFRLVKEGFIDYQYIFSFYQLEFLKSSSILGNSRSHGDNTNYNYNLTDLEELLKILHYVQKIKNKNPLMDLILNRFNYVYERK